MLRPGLTHAVSAPGLAVGRRDDAQGPGHVAILYLFAILLRVRVSGNARTHAPTAASAPRFRASHHLADELALPLALCIVGVLAEE